MEHNMPEIKPQDEIDAAARQTARRKYDGLDLDDGTLSRCWSNERDAFFANGPVWIVAGVVVLIVALAVAAVSV